MKICISTLEKLPLLYCGDESAPPAWATWKWLSPETSSACKLLLEAVAVLVADSVMREQEQQEDKAHSLFFPFEVEELL